MEEYSVFSVCMKCADHLRLGFSGIGGLSGCGDCPPSKAGLALLSPSGERLQGRWALGVPTGQSAYKAIAVVTEGGLAQGDLMEGVQESEAQLGADGTGMEQVPCQLLSAEGATPGVETTPQHDCPFLPDPQS